jgi:carbamoyl-phosphate synthase large subunit
MRSTGEVMGIAETLAEAFGKAQMAAGVALPQRGEALITVKDADKVHIKPLAERLVALGFAVVATHGTAKALRDAGISAVGVNKVREGSPHVVDRIRAGSIALVVNTTIGAKSIRDSYSIRRQSLLSNVPLVTTIPGAFAFVEAIEAKVGTAPRVKSLQEWGAEVRRA